LKGWDSSIWGGGDGATLIVIVVTRHPRLELPEDRFLPYTLIGELGARPIPVYVARQSTPGSAAQMVVAERFVGGGTEAGADLRREARRISTLANLNIARVREVAERGDDLVVFGDFVDGEKLSTLWRPGDRSSPGLVAPRSKESERLPLEMVLRFLLDVLAGVGALHGLRDSRQQPMKLTHGEISPATILIGVDGVARVLHSIARRAPEARAEAASLDYLAPEVHSNEAYDGRADVFSVGVLLWEALEGKPLSAQQRGAAGLSVRNQAILLPSIPERSPWASALVPVVAKALAAAPEDRWPTAGAMAAEIRKAGGLKIAPASVATAFAKKEFGERAKARRARLESARASAFLARAVRVTPPPAPASMPTPPKLSTDESTPGIVLDSLRPPELAPPALPEMALESPVAAPFSLESLRPPRQTAPPISEATATPEQSSPVDEIERLPSLAPWPDAALAAAPSLPPVQEPLVSRPPGGHLVFAIAAALSVAFISLIMFRVLHPKHETLDSDVHVASAAAAAPVVASSLAGAPLSPAPSAAAPSASSAAPVGVHGSSPHAKVGAKTKTPAAAAQHTTSAPVRAAGHKPVSG
jgi:hypothetical protein